MATIQPPPTYAELVVIDEVSGRARFNPIWLKWFIDLAQFVNASGGVTGAAHNSLAGLQGGTVGGGGQFYHLTQSQHSRATTAAQANFGGTGLTAYAVGDLLYASGAAALARRAIGSAGNVLTVSGGLPVWAAPATSGTVTSVNVSGGTTGLTFSGGPVTGAGTITADGTLAPTNGGTGVVNAGTITLGGNLTTSGAFASTFTMTDVTTVTFPTSGTLGSLSATQTWTATNTLTKSGDGLTGSAIAISAARACFHMHESDAAADTKKWNLIAESGLWRLRMQDDAESADKDVFIATRTANVLTDVAVGNTTDNPTFTARGTGGIRHGSSTLLTTTAALTNGAAAATGTLTNAPAAGNPTKWVPINDNGTTRYIPAW